MQAWFDLLILSHPTMPARLKICQIHLIVKTIHLIETNLMYALMNVCYHITNEIYQITDRLMKQWFNNVVSVQPNH